jgi:arylsulfatase A-like enzyme
MIFLQGRPPRAWIVVGLLAGLLLGGCGGFGTGGSRNDFPNVLLISVDSLRSDHADGVAGSIGTGPRLAALASEGTSFRTVTACAPWTTPSMMSALTGLYPWSHHVRDHNFSLSPKAALLAERLKALGYETGAIVPSATLREDFGFSRGFDFFSNGRYGHDVITSPAMTGEALNWLAGRTGKAPFFCWIHFWDPHYNYLPPAPFDRSFDSGWRPPDGTAYNLTVLKNSPWAVKKEEAAYLESQYRGELLYTDKYVGELLDFLDEKGLRDKTLVVLVGDHGEAFEEHGWLTHTMTVYEEMTRVPLVVRWPGRIPAGRRIDRPVSLVNLAPTLLDLVGQPAAGEEMEGASLRPLIEDRPAELPPVVSETIRQQSVASLRDGEWKYVLDMDTCKGELYRLSADPGESRDLSQSAPQDAARLRADILRFYSDRPMAVRIPLVRVEEQRSEDTALLRSLGYLATDRFGDAITYSGRTDPGHCR